MKLYEIANEYRTLLDWIEEHEEEMSAEGGEHPELIDSLNKIEGEFEAKAENVALMVRELDAEAGAWKTEADRLTRHARACTARAGWLKEYLLAQMRRMDLRRVVGKKIKITRTKNSRPSIAVPEGGEIPEQYQKITISLDNQRAYADLKAADKLPPEPGEYEIDGFKVVRGEHVRLT